MKFWMKCHALSNGDISSVKFAWIKYITDWKRCGPGFFAGVSVTKRGVWPNTVRKVASTR